jgi:hypothetical protein
VKEAMLTSASTSVRSSQAVVERSSTGTRAGSCQNLQGKTLLRANQMITLGAGLSILSRRSHSRT